MICSPFKALKGQVKNGIFEQSLTRMLRIILERGYNMVKREKILAYKTQHGSRRSSETHMCIVLCARKNTWHQSGVSHWNCSSYSPCPTIFHLSFSMPCLGNNISHSLKGPIPHTRQICNTGLMQVPRESTKRKNHGSLEDFPRQYLS